MNEDPNQSPLMYGNLTGSVSAKVAEVFLTAGTAFQKLGDLTLQLNSATESQENMKWTDRDIDNLKTALDRFAGDLENISQAVQNRTTKQIKLDLKRKAAGELDRGSPAAPPARKNVPPPKKSTGGGSKAYGAAVTPRPAPAAPAPPHPGMYQQPAFDDGLTDIGPPTF